MMRRATLLVALLLAAPPPVEAHMGSHEVQVRSNFFEPRELAVDPGETVTWVVVDGGHTVTSDDPGLFDSGLLGQEGGTFEWTAPAEDAWIFYHCRIHGVAGDGESVGRGMAAAIKVGDPPPPPTTLEVRPVPSPEWPALADALAALNERTRYRIELAPGTYPRPPDLTPQGLFPQGTSGTRYPSFELTLRGMGSSPADVVIAGDASSVVSASVDGVFVENLTVGGATGAALYWDNVHRFGAADVVVDGTPKFGTRARRSRLGRLHSVSVSGATVAGISIEECAECDVHVDAVTISDSLQGLSALNAGTLVVQRSSFSNNGVGIALKTSAGQTAPVRGTHVFGNTIAGNTNRAIEQPPPSARLDFPVGAGVWIGGASYAVIEHNSISASSYGVVVTGAALFDRIVYNAVSDSVEADLAWDGIGANVCFSGNTTPEGAEPTTDPAGAQTIYDCALPATAGVPMPSITATVLAWGMRLDG